MSRVAVIGLGYVGLPLAVAFARRGHDVVGIDIHAAKLEELRRGVDRTGEVAPEELKSCGMRLSADFSVIADRQFVIVAVPTPVYETHQPDFRPLLSASEAIAPHLRDRVVVVYESTVYPGVTEDICKPVLEAAGKVQGRDFRLGYSPERINPGDREHTIHKVVKIVSGEDAPTLEEVATLYSSVVDAGVYRAQSIKVAEAAKVIENTQRDINIALMNELALIFDRVGIRTLDVLKAAGTKWNFLKFSPGLVGGHCIGVDPYYLTHLAESLGHIPQVITAGRRINDGMGKFVAEKTVKLLIRHHDHVKAARVLVLGLTFKENVPDFRNSRVRDIVKELREYQVEVFAHDPFAEPGVEIEEFDLTPVTLEKCPKVDALILAVQHKEYAGFDGARLKAFFNPQRQPIVVDVKGGFAPLKLEDRGFSYWLL